MRCTRNWKVSDALQEVEHLHRLRHFHIVQLVGSYLQGRTFSILLYPAADCHLGTFLEETGNVFTLDDDNLRRKIFLASTLSCLASTVAFIHSNTTRHMDIKPANVLIKAVKNSHPERHWRVYLADFGLSRSFAAQDHSQTDGPTARTPKYCAPEVYEGKLHGRSADIFSLGCVFLEILSVLYGNSPCDFADFRRGENGSDESFRGNLDRISEWIDILISSPIGHQETLTKSLVWGDKGIYPVLPPGLLDIVRQMLRHDPNERPTALFIQEFFELGGYYCENLFANSGCCLSGPEPYVASYLTSKEDM
ncbi:kinase-like protein [Melanomma pulvis-pyrius CBS 109.77]|uniref:Kinase-like protein n=1 Tax=Melanomma pulvis-pyrius CBS 109.77 TaxID=1314802 RepID=A0A6A6X8T5_9PLEO|nr:kinase-like protein [Melanomma pulvis-pyrius CBS 109.77]